MKIGILALQGAFREHEEALKKLGIHYVELRKKEDLSSGIDAIILPGGESSVQGKLLRELEMYDIIRQEIQNGLPTLATCAGLILLAENIEEQTQTHFATLTKTVRRNAYGRQLGSFSCEGEVKGFGKIPMEFIRAPYISEVSKDVDVLSQVDKKIVAVRYGAQYAFAFHPELNDEPVVHQTFVEGI